MHRHARHCNVKPYRGTPPPLHLERGDAMNRENGKIKRPPRAKHSKSSKRKGDRYIDRTAKGDEDKSCLDSIRVPKLAENAYNRIANVPDTVLWMRSIKITICSMDRFAYKLKGTSFDCIGTFRGCNRFSPPPSSSLLFPRLRLARDARPLLLLFRPAKSPRFRDCYVEQNRGRIASALNDGDERERERETKSSKVSSVKGEKREKR